MSVIIKVFCYLIMQVNLLLSILFLLRGHNYPGGGFIGSLIACAGVCFYIIAFKKIPGFIVGRCNFLINLGISCLLISLISPVFVNKNILTGMWLKINFFNLTFKIGTPLLFDTGIFLSILSSLIWIIAYLEDDLYD